MPTQFKKLPKSQAELTLIIDSHKLAEAYEKQYQKISPEITVKGFRPGKAPRNLIETTIGHDKIYQEALNDLIFDAYREAIKEHNLNPISYPEFKIDLPKEKEKIENLKEIKVLATISLRPQAKLGNYKKLKVKRGEPKKVTDKDVKELIDASFESWKSKLEAEKNRQKDVKIETAANLKEAKIKAGEAQKKDDFFDISKLGQNSFEDFLKANQVQTREELDEKIKKLLEEQKMHQVEQEYLKTLFDKLIEITEIEIPDILVEQELADMEKNLEAQLAPLKISLDEYLKHQKKERSSLHKEWHTQAEKSVKLEFALAALAEKEKVIVLDEELTTVINSITDPHLKTELEKPEQKVYIKYQIQREKTVNKLKEIAAQN